MNRVELHYQYSNKRVMVWPKHPPQISEKRSGFAVGIINHTVDLIGLRIL